MILARRSDILGMPSAAAGVYGAAGRTGAATPAGSLRNVTETGSDGAASAPGPAGNEDER
jgi:hypothetical protein